MKRRDIVVSGSVAAGAATMGFSAPSRAQDSIEWTMVMPWPRNTPGVGVAAQRFADRVTEMSAGRLSIKLYAGGELVPPFSELDAVESSTVDIAHGTPYYSVGKSPALHFFTGVPFGYTAPELAGWMYYGEGMTLWREVYDQFNVIPFYAGSSGVQAGGWFRKEINSLDDLKGLNFRISGLGGDVMARLGVNTVLLPPGEISPSLLNGQIDAAEWIGPWNDRAFGLYKVAKYYYTPAFHEPGPGLEIIVNKDSWAALSADLQLIIEVAASATANETYADFVYHNIDAFGPLVEENEVEVRKFPDDVVAALGQATRESLEELAATDEMTQKIYASFMDFLMKSDAYALDFDLPILQMRHQALQG